MRQLTLPHETFFSIWILGVRVYQNKMALIATLASYS